MYTSYPRYGKLSFQNQQKEAKHFFVIFEHVLIAAQSKCNLECYINILFTFSLGLMSARGPL